jgi:hypothetical protein
MTAAKSSLEASITHSAQLAAAVNSGALQLQSQLQRYADRAASLEVALKRAEDAVEAQTAELEECTVRGHHAYGPPIHRATVLLISNCVHLLLLC